MQKEDTKMEEWTEWDEAEKSANEEIGKAEEAIAAAEAAMEAWANRNCFPDSDEVA